MTLDTVIDLWHIQETWVARDPLWGDDACASASMVPSSQGPGNADLRQLQRPLTSDSSFSPDVSTSGRESLHCLSRHHPEGGLEASSF